jgi:hypothetical protein
VSPAGVVALKLSCPAHATCTGTVTLTTASAVAAKAKKKILTLASASYSIAGGGVKVITLHLSSKARKLLVKSHSLKARALVAGHNSAGAPSTTIVPLTLKLKKH